MKFLIEWWPHITGTLSLFAGFIFKDKIWNLIKTIIKSLIPKHIDALDAHEKRDDERFENIKSGMSDSELRIIQAMNENFGYFREDLRDLRISTDKKFENQDHKFDRMEKTNQDLLFRYFDTKDKAS